MNRLYTLTFVAIVALLSSSVRAETKSISIFEGQKVEVSVPDGWTSEDRQDPGTGIQALALSDPKHEVELLISFLPDTDGNLTTRKDLDERARALFSQYLSQAIEKEVKLTHFDTSDGIGVFASFTDSKIDPKKVPEGEHLISTTGLRSWKGAYLIFTLLTDSRDSAAYTTALAIVTGGLKVKLPGAR